MKSLISLIQDFFLISITEILKSTSLAVSKLGTSMNPLSIAPQQRTHKHSPLLIVDAGQISVDDCMVGGQVQGAEISCDCPGGGERRA